MSGPVFTVADDIIIFCQQKTMAEDKTTKGGHAPHKRCSSKNDYSIDGLLFVCGVPFVCVNY